MGWIAFIGLLVALLGGVAPALGAQPLRLGAYAPSAAGDQSGLERFERAIGRPLAVASEYQAWGGSWSEPHPEWWSDLSGAGRRDLLITWEPWVPGGAARQPRFGLRSIVAGRHDAYIRRWAHALAAYGRRVYLRPLHEMNGTWYPWAGAVAGNSPALYVRAWRRLHRIFDQEGARNVRWVWSPLVDDVPAGNRFERYYPGRRYVDLLALDGYNWGRDSPAEGGRRSFDAVFAGAYARIARLGPQPVWFAEVGSAPDRGARAGWVTAMFRGIAAGGYPRLRALVWFNADRERDWRLDAGLADARALSRAARALGRDRS